MAMVLVSSNALRLTPTAPLDLPDLDLGLVLTLSQSFLCFDVLEKRGVAFVEAPREALPPRVDASLRPPPDEMRAPGGSFGFQFILRRRSLRRSGVPGSSSPPDDDVDDAEEPWRRWPWLRRSSLSKELRSTMTPMDRAGGGLEGAASSSGAEE